MIMIYGELNQAPHFFNPPKSLNCRFNNYRFNDFPFMRRYNMDQSEHKEN